MTDPDNGTAHGPAPDEPRYWLDSRANVDRLVRGFYAVCALLFVIDFLIPKHGPKHGPFAIEHTVGFYAIFGFVACSAVILGAKVLRVLVMRSEDYYDR